MTSIFTEEVKCNKNHYELSALLPDFPPELQRLIERLAGGTFKQASQPRKGVESPKGKNIDQIYEEIKDLSKILLISSDHFLKKNHLTLCQQLQNQVRHDLVNAVIRSELPKAIKQNAIERLSGIFEAHMFSKEEAPRMLKETSFYLQTINSRLQTRIKACEGLMNDLNKNIPIIQSLNKMTINLFSACV